MCQSVYGICNVFDTSQTKPHTTPNMKNTHPQVYTNINLMIFPNSILVKQVDISKHDKPNI